MAAEYTKRILKELELFPLWELKDKDIALPISKEEVKPIETDLFFVFKINGVKGSLLLLSQNVVLEKEGAVQELFLNIAKFITVTIGQDTFQKNHLLILTKDQLSDLYLNNPPKHLLAFGLNNHFFEEYKTNNLMNNVTLNIKHTLGLNHLLQNPKDKKLVWENILDLIKDF